MTDAAHREVVTHDVAAIAGFSGLRIIESSMLTIGPFEDWSDVRSHGRAARRRKQGHKQRIRFYYKPDPKFVRYGDTIVGHPVTVAALRQHLVEQKG